VVFPEEKLIRWFFFRSFPLGSRLALWRRLAHSLVMPELGKFINPRRRRSASSDAALRAEQERVEAMTIEERVKAALSMRERFAWLQPVSKDK